MSGAEFFYRGENYDTRVALALACIDALEKRIRQLEAMSGAPEA